MKRQLLWIITLSLFLTGCWDQELLKDTNLIMSVGLDLYEDGKVEVSITSLTGNTETDQPAGSGGEQVEKKLVSEVGDTVRNARVNIDRKIPKTLNASKNEIVLMSDEMAEQNISSFLDLFYRDPLSDLSAKFAIVKGSAKKMIEAVSQKDPLVGPYLSEIIKSQEKKFIISEENIGSVESEIRSKGMGAIFPLLELINNEPNVIGSGIIHDNKLVGILTPEESFLSLIFTGQKPEEAVITLKVLQDLEPMVKNYMTLVIRDSKRDMDVKVSKDGTIVVNLKTELFAHIQEFDHEEKFQEEDRKKFSKIASKELTEKAKKTIRKLQAHNCDLYRIGHHLKANHPEQWKQVNWEQAYKKVQFHSSVKVVIMNSGIYE
jgi:spore germination protein KC